METNSANSKHNVDTSFLEVKNKVISLVGEAKNVSELSDTIAYIHYSILLSKTITDALLSKDFPLRDR